MLDAIGSFLYGSVPVTFESRYTLSKSVERLQETTRRNVLRAITSQKAVGKVSESRVVLQRVIPFVGNSFKPYFVGRFEQSERGVVLVGQFTMHWAIKIFNTVWLGFCMLWTFLATVGVAYSSPNKWYLPLFGVGMLFAGSLLIQLGKWL